MVCMLYLEYNRVAHGWNGGWNHEEWRQFPRETNCFCWGRKLATKKPLLYHNTFFSLRFYSTPWCANFFRPS